MKDKIGGRRQGNCAKVLAREESKSRMHDLRNVLSRAKLCLMGSMVGKTCIAWCIRGKNSRCAEKNRESVILAVTMADNGQRTGGNDGGRKEGRKECVK